MNPKLQAALRSNWLLLPLVLVVGFVVYHLIVTMELVRYHNDDVYLLRYTSVTRPGGVDGFPPGTKFTVEHSRPPIPDMIYVTDGTHEMAIEPNAVTHDPDRAHALAANDRQMQARFLAAQAAAKAHVLQVERDAQLARAHDIDLMNAQQYPLAIPAVPRPPVVPTPARTTPAIR